MKKKKILIAVIAVILLFLLLIPAPIRYEDGGSVGYKALLYEVIKLHELGGNDDANPYIGGIEVKILGITVYRSTNG